MGGFEGGSFDQREQIRDAIDIVDLVGRYVSLRRQGANFVGRCPWHDDSRPSLQVNATRQTFKCWVCNIGGDVFSFIMKIENVDFKESMQILADIAGIELKKWAPPRQLHGKNAARLDYDGPLDSEPLPDEAFFSHDEFLRQNVAPNYPPPQLDKSTLYRAMEWLAKKYRDELLNSPEAEEARQYVDERGISPEYAEKYQLGYAPMKYDALLKWINFDRNRTLVLEAAGVLAYREDYDERGRVIARPNFEQTPQLTDLERRKYYDRFRGRLIFPIRDVQNRVVAFGGRLLPNTTLKSPAKYVNSPETPIFHKSKMLYGLDLAREPIRRSGLVLVTEGYTDCIVTSQFGFHNVVAVLGTALGSEHVRILKRFASKMVLLLDGDEAGQKRAKEVLRFFVEQGADMNVLTLPDNDDPCEFLLEKGADAFAKLLDTRTIPALDHAFNTAVEGIDLDVDVVETARALDSLLDIVALYPEDRAAPDDPARLRILGALQRLATRFRVDPSELRRQLTEKRAKARAYAAKTKERDARYEERRQGDDAPQVAAPDPRELWIYPLPGSDGETDEQLRSFFPPFEARLWDDPRFLPNDLEREYLEFMIAAPDHYGLLVARIENDELRSPIARQIDQLARDYLEQGVSPSFDRLILRYDDQRMKTFLIELDEGAAAKGLAASIANPDSRAALLREIYRGFERENIRREVPKEISQLRDKDLSPEERMRALLDVRARQLQRRRDSTP